MYEWLVGVAFVVSTLAGVYFEKKKVLVVPMNDIIETICLNGFITFCVNDMYRYRIGFGDGVTWIGVLYMFIWLDIWFYWVHRLLHIRYYHLHKKHHLFVDSNAFAAIFCSPQEHIFSNLGTLYVTGYAGGLDEYEFAVWATISVVNAVWSHSTTHFSNSRHLVHHSKSTGNYGAGFIMDWLMGTIRYQ
jgi:sterol desaturase/sphingolipid hydroxylase (fatty acid hydroxylase superfamily)